MSCGHGGCTRGTAAQGGCVRGCAGPVLGGAAHSLRGPTSQKARHHPLIRWHYTAILRLDALQERLAGLTRHQPQAWNDGRQRGHHVWTAGHPRRRTSGLRRHRHGAVQTNHGWGGRVSVVGASRRRLRDRNQESVRGVLCPPVTPRGMTQPLPAIHLRHPHAARAWRHDRHAGLCGNVLRLRRRVW